MAEEHVEHSVRVQVKGKAREICAALLFDQSFKFVRGKCALFDQWCSASKVLSIPQLRELVLLEEFKTCLLERGVLYLNEQKGR